MSAAAGDGYETLAGLLEREVSLIGARSFDELAALRVAQAQLRESLPDAAPETARAALERCRLLQNRVEDELLRAREALLVELARVSHAQRAARGYAPARARTRGARVVARA